MKHIFILKYIAINMYLHAYIKDKEKNKIS